MKFELPKLKYNYDGLEPFLDSKTMEIHHSKHHQGYTNKFNKALEGISGLEGLTTEEIIADAQKLIPKGAMQNVINNGGGYVNHKLYFDIMGTDNHEIKGEMKEAIEADFTSVNEFKEAFEQAAQTQFGSGWAFLVVDDKNKLKIVKKQNQDSPLTDGDTPIMAIDVWEHAYYLKYQNKRLAYVKDFWNVIDWEVVRENYKQTIK
jgi:Fe-Mn family superoxide dismutase